MSIYSSPILLERDLQNRIETSGILGLDFEERLVNAFINMVNDLKAVSEHTEIVLLPRNTAWVPYSPDMFSDTTHLSSGDGVDTYTALLAEPYSGILSPE